jgi:iron(III) transport system ATP-binding protein
LFGNYYILTSRQREAFIAANGKSLSDIVTRVRSEDFRLVANEIEGVMGRVERIKFYGGYYEIDVLLVDAVISIRTLDKKVEKGDVVYVAVRE